mmetsp:Transcript_55182/g.82097  ORF Transcript_55182/g.82097 Transcript_55182/m.82097 type:complete len:83 (+) Transcript_55182:218-466(+)
MGQLFKLEYFYMENNNLEGSIPPEFEKLTKLDALHIHKNNITGVITEGVCDLVYKFFLAEFISDCAGTKPEVICDCCTHCWA